MEGIKTILFFLIFSMSVQAQDVQDYQKKLYNELQYDSVKNELVFLQKNRVDTAIIIPSFTTLSNYYVVFYPNGDDFPITNVGVSHWLTTIEPKKDFVIKQNFKTLLDAISEMTSNRKKMKHLERTSGKYKIEWIIDGLPPQTITIDYKDKE